MSREDASLSALQPITCSRNVVDGQTTAPEFWKAAFALEESIASVSASLDGIGAEQATSCPVTPNAGESLLEERLILLEQCVAQALSHAQLMTSTTDVSGLFQTRAAAARAYDMALMLPALLSSVENMERSARITHSLVGCSPPPTAQQQLPTEADRAQANTLFTAAVQMSSALDELEHYMGIVERRLDTISELVSSQKSSEWQIWLESHMPTPADVSPVSCGGMS